MPPQYRPGRYGVPRTGLNYLLQSLAKVESACMATLRAEENLEDVC